MQNDIAIKVSNLSKSYKLYDKPIDRLKESLNPFGKQYHREFYALRDVSFEIMRGETIGIIGKNGSGKSTLLKMITGVVTPTAGKIEVNGKISALLELGAGFNPEFTGIENIYMNGTIMGYSKEEVNSKMKEILAFADIGDFVYQPVKMYSSGMFVRLAFAVNACINPDILIVDEALSVGDVFFQNKCFRKFNEIRTNNTPVLFVSHDLQSIKRFCDKVIWLQNGKMIMFGDKDEVCAEYLNYQFDVFNKQREDIVENLEEEIWRDINNSKEIKQFPKIESINQYENKVSDNVEIISFFICEGKNNKPIKSLIAGQAYSFHIVAKFNSDISEAIFGFVLENAKNIQILAVNTYMSCKKVIPAKAGDIMEIVFSCTIPKLMTGEYLLSPAVAKGNQSNHIMLTWLHNALQINIINTGLNLAIIEVDTDVTINRYDPQQIEIVM